MKIGFSFLVESVFLLCYAAGYDNFQPHKLSFRELALPKDGSFEIMKAALTEVGLLAITDIPGFGEMRRAVLSDVHKCAKKSVDAELSVNAVRHQFEDGTKRFSIVTQTKDGEAHDIYDLQVIECLNFVKEVKAFREMVHSVSNLFISRLDDVIETDVNLKLMLNAVTKQYYHSIEDIVKDGVQLEHFHAYDTESVEMDKEDTSTLELHTDHGLFIAIAPGMFLRQPDEDSDFGFFIQLSSGKVVKPDFGSDDTLVFMLGDGIANWINPKIKLQLRATPHMLRMPANQVRSWYGRMFLPSSDVYIESAKMTFGVIKETVRRSLEGDIKHSVCADGFDLFGRDLQSCAENEIVCWHECRPRLTCQANEELGCVLTSVEDQLVLCTTQHSDFCQLRCYQPSAFNQGNSTFGNDFCNGFAVSMYMDGFNSVGDRRTSCVAFLFPSFILDTPVKYAFAAIGTVLLGIFVEFLVKLRREYMKKYKDSAHKRSYKLGLCCLYGLQVAFGYIAMLIAMTYAIVLFFMIVIGLVFGYALFNMQTPAKEYSDPCCNFDNEVPLGSEAKVDSNDLKAGIAVQNKQTMVL